MRSFASDNNAGVHPAVMEAVLAANIGDAAAYGEDAVSMAADEAIQKLFGAHARIHYVTTGTAANVLGLKAVTRPYESVMCADSAHINVDECGAPENVGGFKLVPVQGTDGKLTVDDLKPHMASRGFVHHSQPKVVSITQCTEYGTVYTAREIRDIADFARANDMYLHLDGARLCNAAAALGLSLEDAACSLGVDLLSFGGTKNGCMCAESVVFITPGLGEEFPYFRKQGMQLISKMRYMAVQFTRLLKDELWRENATRANNAAALLAEKVSAIKNVKITRPVQTNAVFAMIPEKAVAPLQEKFPFYVWDDRTGEVRWMTSFATTDEDVDAFASELNRLV